MNVSVCMASYNGGRYIGKQLESIIKQLDENDEIIIVDDCSTDNSLDVIRSINDKRISIFFNESNKGHVFSFARAISLATKEIIFMSDQDDIWIDNRVASMKNELLNSNAVLISSNSDFIDSDGVKINYMVDGVHSSSSEKNLKNIIEIFAGKGNYYGCAMAFKKELIPVILPIPAYVESHDLWIALAANILKLNLHFDGITLKRRVHGSNASILKRKLMLKLWSRVVFVRSILEIFNRKLSFKKKI